MTDTTPDYAGLSRRLGALAYHIQQTGTADSQDAQTCLEVAYALSTLLERNKQIAALEAERDALAAENERLKEDRARFPDKPDDIGRMIEAHIGNLKAGKKNAEDLADKAFNRAFRAEAALAERDKEIADLNKKFEILKRAYDRERQRPIQILGSNAGGNQP